ncbi:PHP domain-containing protein [Adlercreutzia sp. ZJ242]|uniref:PHP domain-containing protein n=1 Tax=Adlercreutzia sp. ZJ242 TaxID=2709409 RepID=UPI001F150F16|nr:PHP domain-containing protein [Adlercreutzia sp. ZJ242]
MSAEELFEMTEGGAGSVDLHVHTTTSDGSDTFAEVIEQARERGVGTVAFTNHDTTRGLGQARALGAQAGVRVVGGVEISAWDERRGRKVHVLGLGLEEGSPAVEELCAPLLDRRRAATLEQLDRIVEAGLPIDVARALELGEASTCLYKQHLMAAMTDAPYASAEYQGLYRRLFKGEGPCVLEIDYVDARDAVRAVVRDGGLAVLAHPGQLDSYEAASELAAAGLGGIECYHPDHTPVDHVRCKRLADRFGLVLTAGSDYHGAFGRTPHLGFRIPEDYALRRVPSR